MHLGQYCGTVESTVQNQVGVTQWQRLPSICEMEGLGAWISWAQRADSTTALYTSMCFKVQGWRGIYFAHFSACGETWGNTCKEPVLDHGSPQYWLRSWDLTMCLPHWTIWPGPLLCFLQTEFSVAQAGLEPQLILLPQAPVPSLKSLHTSLLTLPVSQKLSRIDVHDWQGCFPTRFLSVSGLKTPCPVLIPSRLCHSLYHTSVFLKEKKYIIKCVLLFYTV